MSVSDRGRRILQLVFGRASPFSTRRQLLGWLLATVGVVGLTVMFAETRGHVSEGSRLLLYFGVVLGSAAAGGTGPALLAAVLAGMAINWFFTPPFYTWTIDDGENILALAIFVTSGVGVSLLGIQVGKRSLEVRAARAEAEALEATNDLRAALLRAVSHDLRMPLSSIKASVTSLRQDDVEWSPDERDEFLAAIEEESDRLNRLVGDLLDMGRLQAGVVQPDVRPVAIDDVISVALADMKGVNGVVVVDVPADMPFALADAALLERSFANVVGNALAAAPEGDAVVVRARHVAGKVAVDVVDRGRGVAPEARTQMFEPFQRVGDRNRDGVGLGLAVARGFVEVMGGQIEALDTPGGGLTMTITLPPAHER